MFRRDVPDISAPNPRGVEAESWAPGGWLRFMRDVPDISGPNPRGVEAESPGGGEIGRSADPLLGICVLYAAAGCEGYLACRPGGSAKPGFADCFRAAGE